MVVYSCDHCQYSTSIKTHFYRHNSTKKHIKKVAFNESFTKKSIQKVYSENNINTIHKNVLLCNPYHNDNPKSENILSSNIKVTHSNTNIYICNFCEKYFTHSNSYYRHIKHYCKMKNKVNTSEITFNDYKEQQNLLIKVLLDSKNEIVASKNELIAEKDKNMKDKEKMYQDFNNSNLFQYNDSRQIKDSFNTMNNTNYVINYISYLEADSMENIKDKFKLTREEFIKASLTDGYRGALFEKAENVIIKPYLEAQEKRPMHTVDCSRKKALYKDNSNDNWTFNPKTTLDHCFKTFHLSAIDHQDQTIKENSDLVIESIEDNLYKQTYFIPTENKDKESIYRDVKNHIYKETKVNKDKLIECDNKLIKNIQKILIE